MWIDRSGGRLRLVDRVKINGKVRRVAVALPKDTPQARRKALEELREKVAAIQNDDGVGKRITLEAAVRDYLDLKDCRNSTKKNAEYSLGKCKGIFGEIALEDLTPALIRRTLYKAPWEPSVINRTLAAFKTFLWWCVDMEYLESNPAQNVKRLKIEKAEQDPSTLYLEQDQLRELLTHLSGMAYYMTQFLALTGMRIGEASALMVDDVGEKYISVTKSYSSREDEVTKPKNSSSIREVFIQPELREMLNEFLKWRKLDIMARGIRPETLFYSPLGNHYREQHFGRALRKYGYHPHMLRHTHVALLAEQGITLEAIARRVGHKGTATTKAVYYHVTEKAKKREESALASVRIM